MSSGDPPPPVHVDPEELRIKIAVQTALQAQMGEFKREFMADFKREVMTEIKTMMMMMMNAASTSTAIVPINKSAVSITQADDPPLQVAPMLPYRLADRRVNDPTRYMPVIGNIYGEGLCRAFAHLVMDAPVPPKLRIPNIPKYAGRTDPMDHLVTFGDAMILSPVSDGVLCRLFVATLVNDARGWFTRLPPQCIYSFADLRDLFLKHFASFKRPVVYSQSLFNMKQGENEPLRSYITRFTHVANTVEDYDSLFTKMAIIHGLKRCPFQWSLNKKPPATLEELLSKAEKYINAEEAEAEMHEFAKKRRYNI